MSDTGVKTFTLTGEAAAGVGGTRKRKKRSTAKMETVKMDHHELPQRQQGGTSPGTTLQIEANKMPNTVTPPPAFTASSGTALAKTTTDSSPAPVAQTGGKPVKVVLEKKKKVTRVVLNPTKVKKLPGVASAAPAQKTRKVAKKIRMSLQGFGKRVTRANTIRVEAKKQSVDDVKKTLVEAKLIKADSKAPESVLRTMYADYMMLKNRAL